MVLCFVWPPRDQVCSAFKHAFLQIIEILSEVAAGLQEYLLCVNIPKV